MSERRSQCQSQDAKEVCLGAYYTPFPGQLYNKIIWSGSLDGSWNDESGILYFLIGIPEENRSN